jgi:hypothetical protein
MQPAGGLLPLRHSELEFFTRAHVRFGSKADIPLLFLATISVKPVIQTNTSNVVGELRIGVESTACNGIRTGTTEGPEVEVEVFDPPGPV